MWGDQHLRYGPALPSEPRTNLESRDEASSFLFSCSDGIKQLSLKHEWMGPLDQQVVGEAFQLGASWAFRTLDSYKKEGDKPQSQPLGNDPPYMVPESNSLRLQT